METKSIIVAVAAAGVSIYGINLYNAASRLSFRPLFPEQISVQQGALKWVQPLVVINAAPQSIPLSSFGFDLTLNNVFLGKIVGWQANTIFTGETVIRGTVIIPLLDLLNALPNLKNEGRRVTFGLDGSASLLRIVQIPIPYFEQSIPVPKLF